jgi:arginyl-tRNA synthetase
MDFRVDIVVAIAKELKEKKSDIDNLIEIPPDSKLGDYAFPCFKFSSKLKKKPNEIAEELSNTLKVNFVDRLEVKGPYLNFFLKPEALVENVLTEVFSKKEKYGSSKEGKEKIMIEFPAPNTNKPLHLGHLRNMFLGQSMTNIFSFLGHKVFPVNLNNDRGVHICKSMWAYQKFGEGKEPDKKSDHFVGDFYVKYNQEANEQSEKEIQEMLQKWEDGDKEVRSLWEKMNKWAFDGFDETYKRLGVNFAKMYYESEFYDKGKDIVLEGLKKKLFYKNEDGAVEIDLEKDGLGKKILLRSDGTSVYMTQDLYLAKKKFDDFGIDRSIYVVGSEQKYHFNVLFKLLKVLGMPYADKCYHLSYGMVRLPDGKIKSREGTIVDADDLLDKVEDLAKKEIEKRHKLNAKEVKERAEKIGIGAFRFFLLKYDSFKDMVYDPKESLSFEGETGPYVQYAHARCCSVLKKSEFDEKIDYGLLKNKEELEVIKILGTFGDVVKTAADNYKPSAIARYLLDLASAFNGFYNNCQIISKDGKLSNARLALVEAVKTVLASGLGLLEIKSPVEM